MPVTAAVGVSAGGVVGDDPGHVGSHVDAALVDQSGATVVAIEPVELPVAQFKVLSSRLCAMSQWAQRAAMMVERF